MPLSRSSSFASILSATVVLSSGCSPTDQGIPADASTSGQGSDVGVASSDDASELDVGPATPTSDGADDATTADSALTPDAEVAGPDAGLAVDAGVDVDAGADVDSTPLTYLNPVLPQDFADPFVLRQGSTYYAFATNAGANNIQAASSPDLAHWTVLPDALPNLPAWAVENAGLTWAPAILQRAPSTFVMYYTARDRASGFQCISYATAASPAGPYLDSSTSAFVCQVSGAQDLCGSIDPSPFADVDGTPYLLWKSDENAAACANAPRLWSAPLGDDGVTLIGPPTQLLIMDEAWQEPIIEGPAMTVVDGTYYLLYSANQYESASYAMGYATCLSPSGPCQNVSLNAPAIASGGSALGPGGGSFFEDALGGRWLAYHAWTDPKTTYAGGGARSLRIDRLSFAGGVLSLAGPTTTPQLL